MSRLKLDPQTKVILVITVIAIGLGLVIGLIGINNTPGGSRVLSSGLVLDYVRRDRTGFRTFEWFFRNTDKERPGVTRGGSGSVVGDGVLPGDLVKLSPKEQEQEINKTQGIRRPFYSAERGTALEKAARGGKACGPASNDVLTKIIGEGNTADYRPSIHGSKEPCASEILAGREPTDKQKAICVALTNAGDSFSSGACAAALDSIQQDRERASNAGRKDPLPCADGCEQEGEVVCALSSRKISVGNDGRPMEAPPGADDLICNIMAGRQWNTRTQTIGVLCNRYKSNPYRNVKSRLNCSCEQQCRDKETIFVDLVQENDEMTDDYEFKTVYRTESIEVSEGDYADLYARLRNGPIDEDVEIWYRITDGKALGIPAGVRTRSGFKPDYRYYAESNYIYPRRSDSVEATNYKGTLEFFGPFVIKAGTDELEMPGVSILEDNEVEGKEDYEVEITALIGDDVITLGNDFYKDVQSTIVSGKIRNGLPGQNNMKVIIVDDEAPEVTATPEP